MQERIVLQPVDKYQIDLIPLDKDKYIKLYDSSLDFLEKDVAYGMLYIFSRQFRELMKNIDKLTISSDVALPSLYFIANTGFFLRSYVPNETIVDLIKQQPDLAVTETDKALLSAINNCINALFNPCDESGIKVKEDLCSFIFFLHTVQEYEYKTQMTLDLSSEDVLSDEYSDAFSEDFFKNMLTNPMFSETNSKMLPLSEADVNRLKNILEYRKKLHETIIAVRKSEEEYAKDEKNNANWELFISWVNQRSIEETNALEMINSNADIKVKLHTFDRFLSDIYDPNVKVLDSQLNLGELRQKMLERLSRACNYLEINTNDNKRFWLDEFDIHTIFSPCSFNCVLIAYHAYLIKGSKRYLYFLLTSLEGFIRNNLDENDTPFELLSNRSTIVERLVRVYSIIIKFYKTHEKTIYALRFDSIQTENTLSGRGFNSDIYRLLGIKETKMLQENLAALSALDYDVSSDLLDDWAFALIGETSMDEYQANLRKYLPNVIDDEEKLLEQTISNRLIVSINAIYILVKTIERLLSEGIIEESKVEEIYRIKKHLSRIENKVVSTTYVAPDSSCFDNEDMNEYRLRRGIDASEIVNKNDERWQLALFELARQNIQELHNEIDKESVLDIKQKMCQEIATFPDSPTKEFVIELVDRESQFISEMLVSQNLGTDEFDKIKESLCNDLGPKSYILPEKAIDALTTAELLFSRYAILEFADVGFDYSCISALYYQAVETMYNELLWSKYAAYLNNLEINHDYFGNLYGNQRTQYLVQGYLPLDSPYSYMSRTKRIHNSLTMGTFAALIQHLTSDSPNSIRHFRSFLENVFGFEDSSYSTEEYQIFQQHINELSSQMNVASPRRNDASHGWHKISLSECKTDKRIVLSDVVSIRNDYLGLVRLFLSLYRLES